MIIESINLETGNKKKWFVPTVKDSLASSKASYGEQWDKIEREVVKGGIPTLMPQYFD